MKKKLLKLIDELDFALQPIVNINSGEVYAFEAFLRNFQKAGFKSINALLDNAYENKTLYAMDVLLREKLLKKTSELYKEKTFYLFYNLDSRILQMNDYTNGLTKRLLSSLGYPEDFIAFEISEKQEFKSSIEAYSVFKAYSLQGYSIVLDDFGSGFSGLKMLYYTNPQYIKIDRFFISDMLNNSRKKIFVENIINMAHQFNIKVIANEVETSQELKVCKEIGCDFIQGNIIKKATILTTKLNFKYYINKIS